MISFTFTYYVFLYNRHFYADKTNTVMWPRNQYVALIWCHAPHPRDISGSDRLNLASFRNFSVSYSWFLIQETQLHLIIFT